MLLVCLQLCYGAIRGPDGIDISIRAQVPELPSGGCRPFLRLDLVADQVQTVASTLEEYDKACPCSSS